MINLISIEKKRDIRAARINVILLQYCVMLLTLGLVMALVYGIGFWLVTNDKRAVNEKLASQSEQSKTFEAVEKQADSFRQNLAIAKQILGKETSYSTFLTTLAGDLPSGTILTNLSIGGPANSSKTGMNIDARANSYAKVLELKNKLEQSVLFEDVSIVNASRPDDITKLVGTEGRYPFVASYNAKLTVTAKPTGATP